MQLFVLFFLLLETQLVGPAFMDVDVWVVGVRTTQLIQLLPGILRSAVIPDAGKIVSCY